MMSRYHAPDDDRQRGPRRPLVLARARLVSARLSLLALAAILLACGGTAPSPGADDGPPRPDPAPPASGQRRVVVTSDESVILGAIGTTARFAAHVVDAAGEVVPDAVVVWHSSQPDVVTVAADGTARAEVALGSAVLRATSEGALEGVANVIVAEPRAATVLIGSASVVEALADSVVLDARLLDQQIVAGAVLVSGSRAGLLVRAEDVERDGDLVRLRVAPASLDDAFAALRFDVTGTPLDESFPNDAPGVARSTSGDGFRCELGGSLVNVAMTAFSYQGGTAYLTPYAKGDLAARQFEFGVAGDLEFEVVVGQLEIGANLQGNVRCDAATRPLGEQRAAVRVGPVTLGTGFDYTYGVDLDLQHDGAAITITGPEVRVEARYVAGIAIDGASVRPVHEFMGGDGSGTRLGNVTAADSSLERSVTATVRPRLTIGQRLAVGLGRPGSAGAATLAEFRFLETTLYAGLSFAMALPVDKDEREYRGPMWTVFAGATASLMADVGLADLGAALGRFLPAWVDLSVDLGRVVLFDVRLYLEQASRGSVGASQPSVLGRGEEVTMAASFPPPDEAVAALRPGDRIEFVSWRDGAREPVVLGTTTLAADGTALFSWTPDPVEDAGWHTITARAYDRAYGLGADKPVAAATTSVLVGIVEAVVDVEFRQTVHRPGGVADRDVSIVASSVVPLRRLSDGYLHPTGGRIDQVDAATVHALECGYFPEQLGFRIPPRSWTQATTEVRNGVYVQVDPAAGAIQVFGPGVRGGGSMVCDQYAYSPEEGITWHGVETRPWVFDFGPIVYPAPGSGGVTYDTPTELDERGMVRWFFPAALDGLGEAGGPSFDQGIEFAISGTSMPDTFPDRGSLGTFHYRVTLRMADATEP